MPVLKSSPAMVSLRSPVKTNAVNALAIAAYALAVMLNCLLVASRVLLGIEEVLMSEKWFPIPGFEGLYEITRDGLVRSLDRKDSIGRNRKGKLLQYRWTKGYASVSLSRNAIPVSHKVHALVLLAFRGPRPPGQVCRHLDGNQENNSINNLAYGTQRDNMADMDSHGRRYLVTSEKSWKAKLSNSQVKEIRKRCAIGLLKQKEICEQSGLSQSSVSALLLGKTWKSAGGPIKGKDYV